MSDVWVIDQAHMHLWLDDPSQEHVRDVLTKFGVKCMRLTGAIGRADLTTYVHEVAGRKFEAIWSTRTNIVQTDTWWVEFAHLNKHRCWVMSFDGTFDAEAFHTDITLLKMDPP